MKFGSLFSGIGGFDLGFERAGMECAWQCEIDVPATGVLKKQFGKEIVDDVKKITAANTEPVELICGGFPCQDLSVAGKRKGLAGERSGLWYEFHRILAELNPGWVVIENVPGLLNSNQGEDFAVILRGLEELGYFVAWRILDSQHFGVPQRRRRVFIVGSLGNGASAEVLFESEGVCWDTPQGKKTGEGTTRVVAPSLTATNDPSRSPQASEVTQQVAAVLRANICNIGPVEALDFGGHGGSYNGQEAYNNKLIVQPQKTDDILVLNDQGGSVMAVSKNITGTLREKMNGHPPSIIQKVYEHHPNDSRVKESPGVSPTLSKRMETGGGNVHLVHGVGAVRRLTTLECERLQGFPDGWTEGQSDTQRYKQLGNAVTVNVAEWIGRRIVAL